MRKKAKKCKFRKNQKHYKSQKQNNRPVNKKRIRYAKFLQRGYRVECWIVWENGKPFFSIKLFSAKTKEFIKEVKMSPLSGEVSFGWNILGICIDDHEDLVTKVEETLKNLPNLNNQKPA